MVYKSRLLCCHLAATSATVSSGSVQQDLLCDCLLDLVPKGRCDFLALLRDVLLQKFRLTIKLLLAGLQTALLRLVVVLAPLLGVK